MVRIRVAKNKLADGHFQTVTFFFLPAGVFLDGFPLLPPEIGFVPSG